MTSKSVATGLGPTRWVEKPLVAAGELPGRIHPLPPAIACSSMSSYRRVAGLSRSPELVRPGILIPPTPPGF